MGHAHCRPVKASQTPRNACCGGSNSLDLPDKSQSLVVVDLNDNRREISVGRSGDETPEESPLAISKSRPQRPQGLFRCNLGLSSGPRVEVSQVQPRRALVSWTCRPGLSARKFHIDVKSTPGKDREGQAVAFFEADGTASCLELPEGTLDRAGGPYQVEVLMEHGPVDRPQLSQPGVSAIFSTPAEPPKAVQQLELAEEPTEHGFRVRWAPPEDDGGAALENYEVMLHVPEAHGGDELPDIDLSMQSLTIGCGSGYLSSAQQQPEAAGSGTRCTRTTALQRSFDGLAPGSGPYRVEVRARSEAGLLGEVASLPVSTRVAAPAVPTGLRARLQPSWPCGSEGGPGTPRSTREELGAQDVDIVRLEFRAPATDGGRPLETYLIFTQEEREEELPLEDGKLPSTRKPGHSYHTPVCAVAAYDAATGGLLMPNCACACDVAVEPNRVYTFSVEASNGTLRSGPSEAAASVFVPARVPLPPRGPPEAFSVEGGFAAELRWVGPVSGGGMLLASFKIGVIGPIPDGGACSAFDLRSEANDVQREVTVSCASALAAANECLSCMNWEPAQVAPHEAVYGARVDGLQASSKYRFVVAASNAVGTGCWSTPSSSVRMPVAAPPTPVNAVATVTVDKNQQVMVTVTWECGRGHAGSGSVAAFHVMLMPAYTPSAASSTSDPVIRERVAASGSLPGRRVSWASQLSKPGQYNVEVIAESGSGQRSAPAVLALDVRPEAFPPPAPDQPNAPHWAEEPVLVLGPTTDGEAQFGDFDPGTWLQALLLWHDGDPNPFAAPVAKPAARTSSGPQASLIDVLCYFRRPGSSEAHLATLATGVTASRLQVALPAHVPMSLRLVARNDTGSSSSTAKVLKKGSAVKVQSEPLLLLLNEAGEHLRPTWEVWSRNSPDGQPPRWRELPDSLQAALEEHWLEGHPKVSFEFLPDTEGDGGALAPAKYEMTFGDDRQVQHSVRRAGVAGWTAKARRTVRDGEGEDAALPSLAAEEQCVVCMERRRTHAFMHSDTGDGHLAVCGGCAEAYKAELAAGGAARQLRTCPMCRRHFTAVQRIYQ